MYAALASSLLRFSLDFQAIHLALSTTRNLEGADPVAGPVVAYLNKA